MSRKSDAPLITVAEVIEGLQRLDPKLECIGGWEGNPLRMSVEDGRVVFIDHTNPEYAEGWPAVETCWGGAYQEGTSNPRHVEVHCETHGHVMASCHPRPHGNCVNPNPRLVERRACQFPCPEKEYTDEELGLPSDEKMIDFDLPEQQS